LALERGWRKTGQLANVAARWERDGGAVVVPLNLQSPDFPLRWAEMVVDLADASDTDPQGLMLAIMHEGSDVAEFRALGGTHIDDSIPLGDAEMLIGSVRQAMTASANAVVQPRSYFGHSIPKVAREHAKSVRMGQTRRGSYIIPIISRVPILEPPDNDDDPLFEDLAYEPFSRQAMRRLAEGLSALQTLTASGSMPNASTMNESVGRGLSHELCDAVADSLESISIDQLQVSFSWARRLPVVHPTERVVLDSSVAEVVRGVSNYLRGEQVVGEQTLAGFVKVLDRGEDDEEGKVTIRALVRDKPRNVSLLLDAEQYDVASHANNERVPVSVTGQLERAPGKALRFLSVRDFGPIESFPTTP
jgi:hypothetical protein